MESKEVMKKLKEWMWNSIIYFDTNADEENSVIKKITYRNILRKIEELENI